MWGTVTVTLDQAIHLIAVNGEMELAIVPAFTTGPEGSSTQSSLVLDPINTAIDLLLASTADSATSRQNSRRTH